MRADEVTLSFTCGQDWAAMEPRNADGTVRHCGGCDRDVTDLSAMSEKAARACLASVDAEGRRPCVRYGVARGEVLFGIREPSMTRRVLVATAALALAVPAAAMFRTTVGEPEAARPGASSGMNHLEAFGDLHVDPTGDAPCDPAEKATAEAANGMLPATLPPPTVTGMMGTFAPTPAPTKHLMGKPVVRKHMLMGGVQAPPPEPVQPERVLMGDVAE